MFTHKKPDYKVKALRPCLGRIRQSMLQVAEKGAKETSFQGAARLLVLTDNSFLYQFQTFKGAAGWSR